jgi:hypothetical protein
MCTVRASAAPVQKDSRDAGAIRRGSSNAAKHVPRTMAEDYARQLDAFRLGFFNAIGLVTATGNSWVAY